MLSFGRASFGSEDVIQEPTQRILVLLCQELAGLDTGPDLLAVERSLVESSSPLEVRRIANVCQGSSQLEGAALTSGAERLVLGVCSGEYALAKIQVQARKSAIDPLGVEVVNLGALTGLGYSPARATEKASILLCAAIARARAFRGSQPIHAKPYLRERLSRRSFFRLPLPEYRAVPSIEASLCAADRGCRACVEVCPNSALQWAGGQVHYDRSRCDPCGLCITTCPCGAITNPSITAAQLEAEVRTLLDPAWGRLQPRGIVFACQESPEPAELHAGWMRVRLPCVGMAPPHWLLAPLLMGASRVGVIPCGDSCAVCQDELIAARAAYCQEFLEAIGAGRELVRVSPALSEPPVGASRRELLERPFEHDSASRVLMTLAREHGAPDDLVLDHPQSPLGVIGISAEACTACSMCAKACPSGALEFSEQRDSVSLSFDTRLCTACGQCLPRCPEAARGAIHLEKRTDAARMSEGRRHLLETEVRRCVACGGPVAPAGMLRRIESLLGSDYAVSLPVLNRYCSDCRGRMSQAP